MKKMLLAVTEPFMIEFHLHLAGVIICDFALAAGHPLANSDLRGRSTPWGDL